MLAVATALAEATASIAKKEKKEKGNFFCITKRGNEGRMLLCFCLFCPCSSWWEVLQQMIQELKNQDSLPVKCLSCYGCSSFSLLLYQLIIWKQISEEWLNRTEEKKRHVHLKNVSYVAHLKNSGTVSHFVYFWGFFNFAVCQNSSGPHVFSGSTGSFIPTRCFGFM